jgi:hypothetical protein
MQQDEKKGGSTSKVWVLVVLVVGVALGIVLSVVQTSTTAVPWRGHGRGGWGLQLDTPDDVDVILSTVSMVLLAALLLVYVKTYKETKAKFALGLVGVFLALLFQSILTSPLVYGAFGQASEGIGTFLLLADVFKIAAFTVFLYLSLE